MKRSFVITVWMVVLSMALASAQAFAQGEAPRPTYTRGKLLVGPTALSALKSEFTDLGIVLKKDTPYYVHGSGVVSLWGDHEGGCDSVYRYNTPMEPDGGPLMIWGQLELQNPDTHLSDAMKDQYGKDPAYNPQHEYEGVVIGTGLPLKARVFDGGDYGTNSGTLNVSVYEATASGGSPPGGKTGESGGKLGGTGGGKTGGFGGGTKGGPSGPGGPGSPLGASDPCTSDLFYYGVLLGFAHPAIEYDVDRNWAATRIEEAKTYAGTTGLPGLGLDDLARRARSSEPKANVLNAMAGLASDIGRQADHLCECPVFGLGYAFGVAESAAGANLPADRVVLLALQDVDNLLGECGLPAAPTASLKDRLRGGESSLAVYPAIAAARVDMQANLDTLCRCAFPNWAGKWATSYGIVILEVSGSDVTGTFDWKEGKIEGTISDDGRTLTGTWSQAPTYEGPKDKGGLIWKLDEDGLRFKGAWGYGDDSTAGGEWNGDRGR
jgi:hypothetical protein